MEVLVKKGGNLCITS